MSLLCALFAVLVLWAHPGQAQEISVDEQMRPLGRAGQLGVGLGGATGTSGVTAKYYVADMHAIQGIVGIWAWGHNSLGINLDYVQDFGPLADIDAGHLVAYAGAGLGVLLRPGSDVATLRLAPAAVGGLAWQFKTLPLEFALELRPTIVFSDSSGGFFFGTGGAIRWYFL